MIARNEINWSNNDKIIQNGEERYRWKKLLISDAYHGIVCYHVNIVRHLQISSRENLQLLFAKLDSGVLKRPSRRFY